MLQPLRKTLIIPSLSYVLYQLSRLHKRSRVQHPRTHQILLHQLQLILTKLEQLLGVVTDLFFELSKYRISHA